MKNRHFRTDSKVDDYRSYSDHPKRNYIHCNRSLTDRKVIRTHFLAALTIAAVVCPTTSGSLVLGQDVDSETVRDLTKRLDAQEAEIKDLRRLLESGPKVRRLPLVAEECRQPSCEEESDDSQFHALDFFADYDSGFVIRPFCPEENPYELIVNGWIQFRHHGFARDVDSWTDNAGVTRPVRNRNAFDIERGRLIFSGYAVDKRLTYFLQLDGDTDGGHEVDFFDYWWAWEFSDRFQVQMGKRKVPASRQWLLTARRTRFVDRPMANDFFRPDRTVGVFGVGRIAESGHYEVMVGNGYNTANIPNAGTDDRLTFAADNYFDPLGGFGSQIVDYDWTCRPLVRIGHSFVYSPNAADSLGVPLPETDFIRLTDGTRLTQTGALAPGVTVSEFDIVFYGVDAAVKWRGWSMNAEVFLRWIEDIRGNGAIPVTELFQRGYYVEGGRFIVPKKFDVNFRYSQISGLFGDASEYAAGFNWYPLESHKVKISFDVTQLDRSPLNNTTSDILVGDDGTLFRTQFQAEF